MISRRKIEDDLFTGNFDYKAFVHERGARAVVLREVIGPFHLSPRCSVLVIILISINNANLSLRGIIPGNDLESESRLALSILPRARVREEDYIVHPVPSIDRQYVTYRRRMRSHGQEPNPRDR